MLKRFVQGGVAGLLCSGLVLGLWMAGLFERLEFATWGWRVATFARRAHPHPQIKVILLDQSSLDWAKTENQWSWQWPREAYAPILDFLTRGGAKAIAFDVLLTEPSSYGVADDAALGEAIRRSSVVVGAMALSKRAGAATDPPAGSAELPLAVQGLEGWLKDSSLAASPGATFPIPEVATNCTLLANVADNPDPDAQFRRASLFGILNGKPIPSFALATYMAGEKVPPVVRLTSSHLEIGNKSLPIDAQGRAILRYQGKSGTHASFSAAAVIQSELRLRDNEKPVIDPNVFRDCYVFFGYSALGLLDLRPTPLNRAYPGTEVHASTLDNLLTGGFLRDAPVAGVVVFTIILCIVGGGLVAVCRNALQTVVILLCFMPIPTLCAFLAYEPGWWWPMVAPEVAVASALVAGVVLNYATEGRQRAFLNRAFRHYLGADVIEQIVSDPTRLRLGGEKRELTLFFSDIEKFSTFSEKLDPETLTSLLNDYLTDMTDIILEEGGYLDKYIGDAIVAFWNAPVSQPDHAVRGLRVLLRCQRKLMAQQSHYHEKTGVLIKARIGMNTGQVTVGNMGSRDRFNYTVLGDAANLAARLEGANKVFGTYNLVAESTWALSEGQFVGRELGQLRVVGRSKAVRVYEVLGFAGEALPPFVPDFNEGVRLCLEGRWDEATAFFQKHPQDPPSAAYLKLCESKRGAINQPWDGIWSPTEK